MERERERERENFDYSYLTMKKKGTHFVEEAYISD